MRLVIDARMLGRSGIGVYLTNVLPMVCERCAPLDPWILCSPGAQISNGIAPPHRRIAWNARPLTRDEWIRPPVPAGDVLWWAPHFNVPLRFSGPLVVTLHDLMPLVENTGIVARFAVRHWTSRIRRLALRVLCVSEFTRRHAVEIANIDPARTIVIPLGARQPGADAMKSTDVPASGNGPRIGARDRSPEITTSAARSTAAATPYVLFVGIVQPHKNLGRLLRAFEQIASMVPHRLVVVGRHRDLRRIDRDAIEQMARIGPRVEWREDVSDSELRILLTGADLLVQPSTFEGFGLPPLEAMACGTPVLAARAGALPEVCGDAARYCDPTSVEDIAENLTALLLDAGKRTTLAEAGRRRASGFTWARCAERTADAILDAADGSSLLDTRSTAKG